MAKKSNLVGMRFGRLIVLRYTHNNKYGKTMWECRCDCGSNKIICGSNLKNGHTKSCGCFQKEKASEANSNKFVSDKTRKKLSDSWKNRPAVSKETRRKMSDANRGKNNPMFGKKHSEESKEKNSKSQKGSIPWNKGKIGIYSEKTLKRMSILAKQRIKHGLTGTKFYNNAKAAKRRAWKLKQTPLDANQEEISRIYKICSDINARAGKILFHVDHIVPLSKGGLHHQDNLQILRAEDNLKKGSKILY